MTPADEARRDRSIRRLIRSTAGWSASPRNRRERREHARSLKRR